jgi:hypothetical protein
MKTAAFLFVVMFVLGVFIAQNPAGKLTSAYHLSEILHDIGRLDAGFSPHCLGSNPGQLHLKFMVDKVALEAALYELLRVPSAAHH